MPQNNAEDPPRRACTDPIDRSDERLRHIVPVNPNKPYNIKDIITIVLDDQYFFEVQPLFAPNMVIGFGRLNGRPVGIIANQPNYLAGTLDINSSIKAARFVRFCDAFNIPLLTFVDVPGFPRHGTRIWRSVTWSQVTLRLREATVPKITNHSESVRWCLDVMSASIFATTSTWPIHGGDRVMGPEGG
jgi:propionyl-CoA carboxylase beta chain